MRFQLVQDIWYQTDLAKFTVNVELDPQPQRKRFSSFLIMSSDLETISSIVSIPSDSYSRPLYRILI
jgi:hypothetical protein